MSSAAGTHKKLIGSFYKKLHENSGAEDRMIFESTRFTVGPWHPKLQHGGPPLALCVYVMEKKAKELGVENITQVIGRFFRPVPVTKLQVRLSVRYKSKNIAHLDTTLVEVSSGKELMLVSGVCLRSEEISDVQDPPASALVPPRDHKVALDPSGWLQGREGFSENQENTAKNNGAKNSSSQPKPSYGASFLFKPVVSSETQEGSSSISAAPSVPGELGDGPTFFWTKQIVSTVAGEETSDLQKLAAICDSTGGFSFYVSPLEFTFMNADVTLFTLKKLKNKGGDSAIGLLGKTVLNPKEGSGMTTGELFDSADGSHVATCHQSQLLKPRL